MEKVDVIIVGGGLAGLSCAYELADSGMTVLVLERGDFSGSKNVTGGRIYLRPILPYLPDIWEQAPLERHVTKEVFTAMGKTNSATFELYSDRFNQEPCPSYTILRAKFDRWFADLDTRQGFRLVLTGDGVANTDFSDSGHRYYVACLSRFYLQTFETKVGKDAANFVITQTAIGTHPDHKVVGSDLASPDSTDGYFPLVAIIVQIGD